MKVKFDKKLLKAKVAEMNAELAKVRAKFQDEAQVLIAGATTPFFIENPEIKSVSWTQFTPHWMDGEECVFSVNTPTYNVDRSYGAQPISAGSWDPRGPIEVDDEDEEDGDQFDSSSTADLEISIEVVRKAIEDYQAGRSVNSTLSRYPYSYYCCDTARSSDYFDRTTTKYTFNLKKSQDYIATLEQKLESIRNESERYPNKARAIRNFKAMADLITGLDNTIMQSIFGDHVKVTLSKDSVEVNEHSHE